MQLGFIQCDSNKLYQFYTFIWALAAGQRLEGIVCFNVLPSGRPLQENLRILD